MLRAGRSCRRARSGLLVWALRVWVVARLRRELLEDVHALANPCARAAQRIVLQRVVDAVDDRLKARKDLLDIMQRSFASGA